jgi:hypothetical protein
MDEQAAFWRDLPAVVRGDHFRYPYGLRVTPSVSALHAVLDGLLLAAQGRSPPVEGAQRRPRRARVGLSNRDPGRSEPRGAWPSLPPSRSPSLHQERAPAPTRSVAPSRRLPSRSGSSPAHDLKVIEPLVDLGADVSGSHRRVAEDGRPTGAVPTRTWKSIDEAGIALAGACERKAFRRAGASDTARAARVGRYVLLPREHQESGFAELVVLVRDVVTPVTGPQAWRDPTDAGGGRRPAASQAPPAVTPLPSRRGSGATEALDRLC